MLMWSSITSSVSESGIHSLRAMDYRNDKLHVGGITGQKGLIFPSNIPSRSFKILVFQIKGWRSEISAHIELT